MKQLNRTDIVEAIANKTGKNRKDVNEIVGALYDTVEESLAAGNEVTLTGFVSFKRTERKERQGRNPQTGEPMTIKGGPALTVQASTKLKRAVSGK